MSGYTASPVREILPGLFQWSVAWPRYTMESFLIDLPGGGIAIDPQDYPPRSIAAIEARGVAHILLTNHFHERAAALLQRRLGAEVWAPEGDVGELEAVAPDHLYAEGCELPGGLQPIALDGITAGEHALLWSEQRGVLFVGDALGTVSYWTHAERRLGAHPRMRPPHGLQRLLDLDFTHIAVGHGPPVLDTAKAELRAYLGEALADG